MQKGQFSASPCACNWDQSAGSAAAVPPELNKGDVIFPGLLPYAIAPALPGAASAALPHAALGSVSGERMRQSPVTAALEVLSVSRKGRCIRKKNQHHKNPTIFHQLWSEFPPQKYYRAWNSTTDKFCCLQHPWNHRTGGSKGTLGLFGSYRVRKREKKRFKKIQVEAKDRKHIPLSSSKSAKL